MIIFPCFFETNEYQLAIDKYKTLYEIHGDNIRLLLTKNTYTSGYWIENKDDKKRIRESN
jgi:hypothetical protein